MKYKIFLTTALICFLLHTQTTLFIAHASAIPGVYLGAYLGCGAEDSSCIAEEDFNKQTGKNHAIFSKYITTDTTLNSTLIAWAQNVPLPMLVYMPEKGLDNINYGTVSALATQLNEIPLRFKCAGCQTRIGATHGAALTKEMDTRNIIPMELGPTEIM